MEKVSPTQPSPAQQPALPRLRTLSLQEKPKIGRNVPQGGCILPRLHQAKGCLSVTGPKAVG